MLHTNASCAHVIEACHACYADQEASWSWDFDPGYTPVFEFVLHMCNIACLIHLCAMPHSHERQNTQAHMHRHAGVYIVTCLILSHLRSCRP